MSIAIPLWPFVTVTLAIIIIFVLDSHRRKRHYPPGPKPRLFVGNLFDIPTIEPWKVYNDWRKFYGALIHLEIIGYHIVVVNSRTLADRMLEKRSKIYSDRPFIPMMDLMGWTTLNTALLRYGPDWRMHRRLYKQGFRAAVVPDYQPILFSKADQFSSNLRQSPDSFVAHTRTYAAATILATVYGYDISPSNDKLVEIAEQAAATSSDSFHPSSVVVNVLPFLRHLPLRFPIFAFQRIARRTRRILNEMRKLPYEFVKNDMVTGKDNFSLLAKFLEKHTVNGGDDHQEDLIRNALTTAYAAGAETTSSVLVTFFLAMGLHPDIQKRAQREIDTVIGNRQFPSYATDYSNLPYVEAILRETLRWSPVTPLGIPHTAFLDDTIDDYFIPKGTTVISNIWAMTRDESVYPEPESFNPDRFLTEDRACNEDEVLVAFGFGRRACAGRHFAVLTLRTAMAAILSQFEIGQPEDEAGTPIKSLADVKYSDGLISQPSHFRCVIKPRTK